MMKNQIILALIVFCLDPKCQSVYGQDYDNGGDEVNTQTDMFDMINDQLKELSKKCDKNQESIKSFAKVILKMEDKNADSFNKLAKSLNQLESNYAYDISALKNQTLLNAKQIIDVNNTCMNYSKIVLNSPNVLAKSKVEYSLAENVLISDMKSQGYQVIYDKFYSHDTTWGELNAVKSTCSSQSVLCVGGAAVNSDNLLLISCGNCQSILTPTQLNQPVLVNKAYWYFANNYSFGYAPSYQISQGQADTTDTNSNTRLSWHIIPGNGGWRLGSKTGLNNDNNYRKIMLLFS